MKALLTSRYVPLFLGLVFFGLLAIHPMADGPRYIRDSAGFHFDPYSKIHAARNLALTGEAARAYDDWTPHVHSPLYTLAQWGVFKTFGVGLFQMRLVSMAGMALSLGLLMALLRREYGWVAAWLGALLYGANHVIFFSGRSGLIEPMVLGMAALMIYIAVKIFDSEDGRNKWALLAGALAGLTLCTKMNGVYFALAPLIYLLIQFYRTPRVWLAYILGAVAMLALFHGSVWLMHHEDVVRESSFVVSKQKYHASALSNFLSQPVFVKLSHQYVVLIAALTGIPFLVRRAGISQVRKPTTVIMALSLLLGILTFSTLFYRPFRYYIPLIFPACFLTAALMVQLYRTYVGPRPTLSSSKAFWLLCLVLWMFIYDFGILILLEKAEIIGDHKAAFRFGKVLLFSLGTIGLLLAIHRWARPQVKTRLVKVLTVLALAWHVQMNLMLIVSWADNPRYSIYEFSNWLKSDLRDATISGMSPNFSLITNNHYGLRWEDTGINQAAILEGHWTHLVLPYNWQVHEKFENFLGVELRNAVFLGDYPVVNYGHALYAKELHPLTASYQSDGPALSLYNEDNHTVQRAFGLSWDLARGKLLFVADWRIEPKEHMHLKAEHAFFRGEYGLFPETTWVSIRNGAFTCSKTRVLRHRHGIGSASMKFNGREGGHYIGSFARPVGVPDGPSIFAWRVDAPLDASHDIQVTLQQADSETVLSPVHSAHSTSGSYISACIIPGPGILTVRYTGRAAYEVLGFFTMSLHELSEQNLLKTDRTSIPYRPVVDESVEMAPLPLTVPEL